MKYRATFDNGGHWDFEVSDRYNLKMTDDDATKVAQNKANEKPDRKLKYLYWIKKKESMDISPEGLYTMTKNNSMFSQFAHGIIEYCFYTGASLHGASEVCKKSQRRAKSNCAAGRTTKDELLCVGCWEDIGTAITIGMFHGLRGADKNALAERAKERRRSDDQS